MAKGLRPWQPGNIHTLDEYKNPTITNVNSAAHLELVERFRACMEKDRKGREESEAIIKKAEEGLKESQQWLQQKMLQKVAKNTQNSGDNGNGKLCLLIGAVAGLAILIMIMLIFTRHDQQSLLNRATR